MISFIASCEYERLSSGSNKYTELIELMKLKKKSSSAIFD